MTTNLEINLIKAISRLIQSAIERRDWEADPPPSSANTPVSTSNVTKNNKTSSKKSSNSN